MPRSSAADAPDPGRGDRRRSICMVVHAYYPLAEPRVQREALAARDDGFDVTVFSLRGVGEAVEETVDSIRVRRVGLAHHRGAGLGRIAFEYSAFCLAAVLWLALQSLRSPFKIVHVHGPPDFLIAAGLIPRLRGSKLVLDIHDLSSHLFGVRMRGRLGRMIANALVLIERLACRLADEVITVHEPYRGELIAHGVPAYKVHVVMNSVDERLLPAGRKAGPPCSDQGFTVAYHGTLTWLYGTDLIIKALSALRADGIDARALILGDGDALAELRTQVGEFGLERQVELSGRYLPIEEALSAVTGAACGVIPNRPSQINRFALSSKLFEYVMLGIPAAVARLDTLAAHFTDGEVTFFEPGDAASLAGALRWIHEHPLEANTKAEQAKIRAEQYSWSRNRGVLSGVYSAAGRR